MIITELNVIVYCSFGWSIGMTSFEKEIPREIRYQNEQKHNVELYDGEIKILKNLIQAVNSSNRTLSSAKKILLRN